MAHGTDADNIARDGNFQRFVLAFAQHGEGDVGALLPAHALNRLGQCQSQHRLVIQMRDQIIGQHARALGRRVVDRRDHLDQPLINGDFNAKPAKLAARLYLHVFKALGRQIGRMRVERGQHAGQRRLDQLFVAWRIDIFRAHAFQNIAKQRELLVKRQLVAVPVSL